MTYAAVCSSRCARSGPRGRGPASGGRRRRSSRRGGGRCACARGCAGYAGEGFWDGIDECGGVLEKQILWDPLYMTSDANVVKVRRSVYADRERSTYCRISDDARYRLPILGQRYAYPARIFADSLVFVPAPTPLGLIML